MNPDTIPIVTWQNGLKSSGLEMYSSTDFLLTQLLTKSKSILKGHLHRVGREHDKLLLQVKYVDHTNLVAFCSVSTMMHRKDTVRDQTAV